MVRTLSIVGTTLVIVGFLLPSFLLFWTWNESVVMILAAVYFFLWGYYDIDLDWLQFVNDSGLHLFNFNWYLDPALANISQGSELIDTYLNGLAISINLGNLGNTELDLSWMILGFSLLIIVTSIVVGLLKKDTPKISGLLYIIGDDVALAALLLIWDNATSLTFIGGGVENNFLPISLGSLIVLGAGVWNHMKS